MASCGGRWLRVALLGGAGLLTAGVGAYGLTVYDDAPAPSWNAVDYSWDSTVNAASGAPVHAGAAAIKVTPVAAWGALSLRTSAPLAGSGYTSIRFWVFGAGAGGTQLDISTQPTDGGAASTAFTVIAPAGVWTQFVVSLASLGNPAAIARINFQDHTGTVQPAYSVDDIDVVPTGGGGGVYVSENRSIVSSGITRNFVLTHLSPLPAGALPLVFSLHGDGGTGAGMRAALPLEAQTGSPGAVFVYPNGPVNDGGGYIFEYYTYNGRTKEAVFVQDVIALLEAELGIDTQRVYVVGMSGGATMANALGCRLGPGVLRGLGIHSGTLYPVNDGGGNPDFTYTGNGGVSCPLPAAQFIWGMDDNGGGTSFPEGQAVRDNYLATQGCAASSQAWQVAPCIEYDTCGRQLLWCAIPGLPHAIWPGAAEAMWTFIDQTASPVPNLGSDGFESGDLAGWDFAVP